MSESLYDTIGGDAAVRRLVDRFYAHMDTLPEAATIRAMHPADLASSNEKLYWFLSGWLGGPQLFIERRGHPALRARHMPFPVDMSARDAWMACMDRALDETVSDGTARQVIRDALGRLATHMINRQG
jgi:hemoglobin